MKTAFSFLCVVIISSLPALAQETITLTTYYPAPFGVYQRLVTNTLGVGDTNASGIIDANDGPNPAVAGQEGDVWVAGNVGIGTTQPRINLDLRGGINISETSTIVPGYMYTGVSDEPADYDEEFVISMWGDLNGDGAIQPSETGDDRSSIFIGPNFNTGAVGRIELNARKIIVPNSNAKVGIGTTAPSTGQRSLELDVEGDVGAQAYCDANGNNCATPPFGSGDYGGMYLKKTNAPNNNDNVNWECFGTNPYTGACSCPAGYNDHKWGTSYPFSVLWCGAYVYWFHTCWR